MAKKKLGIKIKIKVEYDIISARRAGREIARELGFGSADQTRLATAISELTRNAIQYAGEGVCTISDISNEVNIGIRVIVQDHGPGIGDIGRALEYGFSTGTGLGAGLPGIKKLVSKLDVESEPGNTRVTIEMTRRKP